ncbi:cytochrome P450 [Rhizodiscina lignyota]|uniref:Cytochrome P450 monooxygenase ABA1 n=1 Tax=Rhizodiscina lignyota TaxID=1504668 RepID=A0A9P4IMW6_9PEZI|nr:cytochrome P450 [Rhizodiscina lignyota]
MSLSVIVAFFLAAIIIQSYIRSYLRLRHVPGPWFASFSLAFMTWTIISGRMWLIYNDLQKKYGPLVRIGPNDLITDDPAIIKRMSAVRSDYLRSTWYQSRIDPYVTNIISERDTKVHDKRRAQMAAGYAGRETPMVEADIDAQVLSLVKLLKMKYLSDSKTLRPVDFAEKASFLTLDVITKVAYGFPFGFLQSDSDVHQYMAIMEKFWMPGNIANTLPWLNTILAHPLFLKFVAPKVTDKIGMGKVMGIAKEVVAERFGPDAKDRQDMLGAFVRHGLSQRQAESEVMFQLIAGSDTTATAIRATLLYIVTNPLVISKLRQELDAAASEGRISSPISSTEANALLYLQAVLLEGFRIHPPFTGLAMKEVPPGGDTLCGLFIPEGTRVGHNIWMLQRNKIIYGEDVELFRPERWLDVSADKRAEMEQQLDLIFGYGRWGCMGKSVARMELTKSICELVRQFDFQLINPTQPWTVANYSLFVHHDMWMKITERNSG